MKLPAPQELALCLVGLHQAFNLDQAKELLSPSELKRAEDYRYPPLRRRYILARSILRELLGTYLKQDPKKLSIQLSPKGKPYLEESKIHFNLSHSGDWILYAFTQDMEVGIDIERIRSRYSERVAKRYFSAKEYQHFSALGEEAKRLEFFRLWSAKEAVIKALGESLSYPLSSFTVAPTMALQPIALTQGVSTELYLQHLPLLDDYSVSLASSKAPKNLGLIIYPGQGYSK